MKNSILIFLIYSFIQAQDLTDSQQQICQSIKQLQPGTGFDKYLEKTQQIDQYGLSTCACIHSLLKAKEYKVRSQLTDALKLKKDFWDNLDKKKELIDKQDKSRSKIDYIANNVLHEFMNDSKGTLDLQDLQNQISQQVQAPIQIKFSNKNYHSQVLRVYNKDLFPITPYKLTLSISDLKKDYQATLHHEIMHVLKNHSLYENAIVNQASYSKIDDQIFNNNYLKFRRLTEREADRIPQACNCNAISNEFLNRKYRSYKRALNEKDYALKKMHSSPEKRFEWAVRIAKLKQAEEVLADRNNQIKQNHIPEPDYRIADFS